MRRFALVLPLLFAAILSPALAQSGTNTREIVTDCPTQTFQIYGDKIYCILGEAWYAATPEQRRSMRADPPVYIDMSHGAPIALPADEDRARSEQHGIGGSGSIPGGRGGYLGPCGAGTCR